MQVFPECTLSPELGKKYPRGGLGHGKMRRHWLVLGASVAVLCGLGAYTFIYAEALSYFGPSAG
jgi:hypothetical protein